MARLLRDGHVVEEVPLAYAGEQSTYGGELPAPSVGEFELELLAMDVADANFGRVRQKLRVQP